MKKRKLAAVALFLIFMLALAVIGISLDKQTSEIKEEVLRFHIVANSDSEKDQSDKYAVRDGIAKLCSKLFAHSESKEESMQIAVWNKDVIEQSARNVLLSRGCEDNVSVTLQKRFFPTRHYEGVSLPAGVYDTIDVQIGKAEGKNFWCVMFPDICIGASCKDNKQKMSDVLSDGALELVTEDTPTIQFKFKIIEILEHIRNKFKK